MHFPILSQCLQSPVIYLGRDSHIGNAFQDDKIHKVIKKMLHVTMPPYKRKTERKAPYSNKARPFQCNKSPILKYY